MSTLDIMDMWREILVRLPGESLIRCRAVSKGLRAVIDDPCFVRAHTNHQHQLSSSKIIIQRGDSCYSLDLEALINSYGHQAIAATPLHHDVINTFSSSCNGLVLITHKLNPKALLKICDPLLTICNPLTHERLELPSCPYTGDRNFFERAIGLGYDGTTDDYKAVVILRDRETHVYSLKSDSWRRTINCPRDPDKYGLGVFMCGALNWLSVREYDDEHDDDMIVALDLGTEKYSLLQMPRRNRNHHNELLLNVLGGCLAVCDSSGYEDDSYLDVWVMKVYGDGDSWTKLFSIENEQHNKPAWSGYLSPAAFIMNGRFVFLNDDKRKFFLFDVETKTFKWVRIDGSFKKGSKLDAQQMFVGTIFRLHANCGGGGRVREICSAKRKKVSANVELVFCLRDANGEYNNVSCYERGCQDNFSLEGGNGWLYD